MLLGMQDFDFAQLFAQILLKFTQNLPKKNS